MTLGELRERLSMREFRQWEQQKALEAQQQVNAHAAQAAADAAASNQRPFRG